MRKIFRLAAVAALALVGACGKIGNPLPPSLELPQPVKDLRATRKAGKVTLSWSQPRQNTDNTATRHFGDVKICRAIGPATESLKKCDQPTGSVVQQLPPKDATGPVTLTYSEELPQDFVPEAHANDFAIYAVESQNSRGRADGLSNQIAVPLAPTLPPPSDVKAELQNDGVHITATASSAPSTSSAQFAYRLYRAPVPAPPKATPVVVAEAPAMSQLAITDTSIEWEKTYSYFVTPVTKVASTEIEGADSAPVQVFAHDIFPPAVPTGLQAVFSGSAQQNFIDLTWVPSPDADLAGYNVYRHEQGAAPVRVNTEAVKTPAFRDSGVAAGHTYFYSVSAFDQRNNESARSQETSETVPATQ